MNLQVKYGYIRLINTKADLCEEIKNVDLECPIKEGKIAIIKAVELPKEIPPVSSYRPDGNVILLANPTIAGKIHRPRRCLHQGRQAHHLLDSDRHVWHQVIDWWFPGSLRGL